MSQRTCIFCGGTPTTREHMIPEWASVVLHEDPRSISADRTHWRRGRLSTHTWRSKKPIDFVANCVCRDCNSGWMSDIEAASEEMISEMVKGREVHLDLRQQQAVGKWLALKAIVGRHIDTPVAPVPQEVRDYFRQHREPPKSWHAWITRYEGRHPVYISATDVAAAIRHALLPAPVRSQGILMTMAIGYFAAQVFGISEIVPVRCDPSLLLEVWPHPLLRPLGSTNSDYRFVAWPPERSVDDEQLQQMENSLPQ